MIATHVGSVTEGSGRKKRELGCSAHADHEASFAFCRGTFRQLGAPEPVSVHASRIVVTEVSFLRRGRGLPFKILTHRTVPPQPQ
jgi:hypothetical protein